MGNCLTVMLWTQNWAQNCPYFGFCCCSSVYSTMIVIQNQKIIFLVRVLVHKGIQKREQRLKHEQLVLKSLKLS